MSDETIKICSNHRDYEVPLIWTFAFNGAEYWCPYCGEQEGMLGAGENVPETKTLLERKKIYEKLSKPFLRSRSTLICSWTKYKDKEIKPSDLPPSVIKRHTKIANSWKYNQRIKDKQQRGEL